MIRDAYKPFVLVGIALLLFANTLFYPFVHDDIVFIKQNPNIARFDDLPQIFFGPAAKSTPDVVNAYYRPILELVYRVEYPLFGLNPSGWHFFNVLVHAMNGVLVYLLLGLLGLSASFAFLAALIFLIHPVQSEAVSCVAGISNLLMGAGVLSSLIFYLKDKRAISFLCFVLALFTKEQALMVLPLIFVLDWYRGRKEPVAWGLFVLAAGSFLVFRQSITGAHLLQDILASPVELKLRLLAIAQVVLMYVRIILLPIDLHYYRSTDILTVNLWWWLFLGILLWGALRSERLIKFGVLWFVAALLPILNIVPLINEYSQILTADHFLYLPMIGIVIIVGVFARDLPYKQLKWAMITVICACGIVTVIQNTYWRSELALFKRTMAFEKEFGRGHLLLAKAYYFEKQYPEASEHLSKAYAIMKGYQEKVVTDGPKRFYLGFMKGILFDWAHALEAMGQLEEAKAKYLDAVNIDPKDPVLLNNLGVLLMKMNEIPQAKEYFQKALNIDPAFLPAKSNLKQL